MNCNQVIKLAVIVVVISICEVFGQSIEATYAQGLDRTIYVNCEDKPQYTIQCSG